MFVLPNLYMDVTVVNGHACLNLDLNLPKTSLLPSLNFAFDAEPDRYLPIIHYVHGKYFRSERTVTCLLDQKSDLKPYPLASLLRCRCLYLFPALADPHHLHACSAPNNLQTWWDGERKAGFRQRMYRSS